MTSAPAAQTLNLAEKVAGLQTHQRMQAAGLDGIELECYGHLMDQFCSPLTNTLEAPYGGSFDNRLRFSMDVLAAIRKTM